MDANKELTLKGGPLDGQTFQGLSSQSTFIIEYDNEILHYDIQTGQFKHKRALNYDKRTEQE